MKARIRAWLDETHGASFELVRHFLASIFDSDMFSVPGEWQKVAAGLNGGAALAGHSRVADLHAKLQQNGGGRSVGAVPTRGDLRRHWRRLRLRVLQPAGLPGHSAQYPAKPPVHAGFALRAGHGVCHHARPAAVYRPPTGYRRLVAAGMVPGSVG